MLPNWCSKRNKVRFNICVQIPLWNTQIKVNVIKWTFPSAGTYKSRAVRFLSGKDVETTAKQPNEKVQGTVLNLSRDRKSTASHLDDRGAQRLLLTSTKGLQSEGVAKLTEPGALSAMQLFFPFSMSLSLLLLCLLSVLFRHFNHTCSANCGPKRGRANAPYQKNLQKRVKRSATLWQSPWKR